MVNDANDVKRNQRRPTRREDRSADRLERGAFDDRLDPSSRPRPANENDAYSAALVATLHRSPSRVVFGAAFIFSLLWASLFLTLFFVPGAPEIGMHTSGVSGAATALMSLFLPIVMLFSIAYFLWRAQKMNHISSVLAQTALRLVKPQDLASEGLSTISSNVRKEIDQLIGGIEHAVNRASDLENIVHQEIAHIERAFGANEERIQTLLAGLENQRNALHEAGMMINSESNPLLSHLVHNTSQLETIIGTASGVLNSLEQNLKHSTYELSRTLEDISSKSSLASTEIQNQTVRMEQVAGVLNNETRLFSDNLSHQLSLLDGAAQTLNGEGVHFAHTVQSMESAVIEALRSSSHELATVNSEVSRTIEHMSGVLSEQLHAIGKQVSETVENTASTVSYHLKSACSEATGALLTSTSDLTNHIQASQDSLSEKLLSVSGHFMGHVAQAREELFSYLDHASQEVSARFEGTSKQLFEQMDVRAQEISLHIDGVAVGVFGRLDHAGAEVSAQMTRATESLAEEVTRLEQTGHLFLERAGNLSAEMTDHLVAVASDFSTHIGKAREEITLYFGEASTEATSKLEQTTRSIFERLEEQTTSVITEVDRNAYDLFEKIEKAADGVTARLGHSSDSLAVKVETTCGQFVDRLEHSHGMASDLLDKAARELTQHLDLTTETLSQRLERSSLDILSRLDDTTLKITGELSETGVLLSSKLSETSQDLSGYLLQGAQDLFAKLEITSQDTMASFSEKTSTFSQDLGEATVALKEILETGLSGTTSHLGRLASDMERTLSHTTETISGRLDLTARHIEQTAKTLSAGLEGTLSGFSQNLENTTSQVGQQFSSLSARFDDVSLQISSELDRATSRFYAQLEDHNHILADRLALTSRDIAQHLEKSGDFFFVRMDKAVIDLNHRFEGVHTQLSMMTHGVSEKIESAGHTLISMMGEGTDRLIGGVESVITETCSKINAQGDVIQERFKKASGEALSSFLSSGDSFFERFTDISGELTRRVDVATELFSEVTGDVVARFDHAGDQLARRLDESVLRISGKVEGVVSQSCVTMEQKTKDIAHHFEDITHRYALRVLDRGEDLFSRIHGTVKQLSDGFETASSIFKETTLELVGKLDSLNGEFSSTLLMSAGKLGGDIQTLSQDICQRMEQSIDDLSSRFSGSAERARLSVMTSAESVFSKMDTIATTLHEKFELNSQAFHGMSSDVLGKFDRIGSDFSTLLEQSTQKVTTVLNDRVHHIASELDRSGVDMLSQLSSVSSEISQKLAHSSSGVQAIVETAFHNLNDRLETTQSLLQNVTQEVMSRFDATAETFSVTLGSQTQRMTHEMDGAKEDLVRIFSQKSEQFVQEFSQARHALNDGLAHTKKDILSHFSQTSLAIVTTLEESTALTVGRLNESQSLFQERLSQTNALFSSQLGTVLQSLDHHVDHIGDRLSVRLEEATGRLTSHITGATSQISGSIQDFNAQIEHLVSGRSDLLSDVMEQLKEKQNALNASLEQYVTLVVDHLVVAQARAEDVTKLFSDQTTEASQLLEKSVRHLGQISDQAIQESIQKVELQQEKLLTSLHEALSGTTGEFSQTAQILQKTIQGVVGEVEKMREDLRHAIGGLPEETRQNAEAMRQVISDQVAALQALSDVVRAQSGGAAFSGPGVRPVQPTGGRSDSLLGSKQGADLSFGKPLFPEKTASLIPPEREFPLSVSELLDRPKEEKNKPLTQREPASREVETLVKKLNSASRDLVEALDHRLNTETEQRYSQGETDVYAHVLYGQLSSAFSQKVSDRYGSDRLVRARVDAFLRLFERLLDHLATRQDGEALVDACLSSESGRVYLLLGQASGHLSE